MRKYSYWYSILVGMMAFAVLMANVLSTLVAPYQLGPFSLSGGFIIFPLAYVLSDVFSEVYGYSASRKTGIMMAGMNIAMSLVFIGMYAFLGEERGAGIATLAKNNWIIVIASIVAGQIGDWANDAVFAFMRQKNKGWFLTRALASSVVGETLDSLIFVFGGLVIAFGVPFQIALWTVVSQVVCKLLVETIAFPLTVFLKKVSLKVEDADVYQPAHRYTFAGGKE